MLFNKHKKLEYIRPLLAPFSVLFLGILLWRDFLFKLGVLSKRKLPCKVISVGNISTGGTGKTPLIITLTRFFQKRGISVGILSRGYRRKSSGFLLVTDGFSEPPPWELCGDEPALMAKKLEGIPIVVDKKRFRGGSFLVEHFNPDIILLDDAFQHNSLYRDVDIVLVNSSDRPKDHKLLPTGNLREPWSCIKRADLVLLSKTNLTEESSFIKNKLEKTSLPFFYSSIDLNPALVNCHNNTTMSVKKLKGTRVLLVSAIGDPDGFHSLVQKTGADILKYLIYRAHYSYTKNDLKAIRKIKEEVNADLIITTEKDLLKLKDFSRDMPIHALRIGLNIEDQGFQIISNFIDKIGINN